MISAKPQTIAELEKCLAMDLQSGMLETAASTVTQLIRAVIADEAAKLDGKTICTYPVAPDGDVPKWCLAVAAEICVTFHDNEMIARKLYAAAESELSRRVAEATADKDRRIAELEATNKSLLDGRREIRQELVEAKQQLAAAHAEVERLKEACGNYNGKCGLCGVANKDMLTDSHCAECEVDRLNDELTKLRAENARLSRPVDRDDILRRWTGIGHFVATSADFVAAVEPLLQSERNAREAAEAERDELRDIIECVDGQAGNGTIDRHVLSPQLRDRIDAVLAAHRAEKAKVAT